MQDAPTLPVYGIGEESVVEHDSSPVVATADSANSEVTLLVGEPTTEDWDDNVMLSSATVDDSTEGDSSVLAHKESDMAQAGHGTSNNRGMSPDGNENF